MNYTDPGQSSHSSSRSSSAGSTMSSITSPSGLSFSLEELMFILVGDYELKYYRGGRLITCGTLYHPCFNEAYSYPSSPEIGSTSAGSGAASSTPSSAGEDVTMLSASPYGPTNCEVMSTGNAGNAFTGLIEPSTNGELQSPEQLLGLPARRPIVEQRSSSSLSAASPCAVPPMLSPRLSPTVRNYGHRNFRRTFITEARKTFVMNAFPLKVSTETMSLVDQLFSLLSQCRQAECKELVLTSLTILQPNRRITHPYRTAPPEWWPSSVRYVDSSHLVLQERHALLFHLWFSPLYSDEDILHIEPTAAVKFKGKKKSLRHIFKLVMSIRAAAIQSED